MDSEEVKAFTAYVEKLALPVVYVSAVTGEGLTELVRITEAKLAELPPLVVYEAEYSPEEEAVSSSEDVRQTRIEVRDGVYFVEGEWLYNFMGRINFDDYESLNFFQRVLNKNGVFDRLRQMGINEGDTVNIYDFEFDFVY